MTAAPPYVRRNPRRLFVLRVRSVVRDIVRWLATAVLVGGLATLSLMALWIVGLLTIHTLDRAMSILP